MARNRERGIIQAIITIFLWVKLPSREKMVLKIINDDPDGISVFGTYWNDIVHFLLNNWDIISIIILVESLYGIFTNRNFVYDVVQEIKRLISKLEDKLRR